MRGRLWLNHLIRQIMKIHKDKPYSEREWTEFLGLTLDSVAREMNCYVVRRRVSPRKGEYSGELLNIDAVFIDKTEDEFMPKDLSEWYPFVPPRAVVELENRYNLGRISYSLWKILSVRAPIRVLICYQKEMEQVERLKDRLQDVIWQGSLMKGTDSDLLILIGDESVGDESGWSDYFEVYEWRSDRLEIIEGLDW